MTDHLLYYWNNFLTYLILPIQRIHKWNIIDVGFIHTYLL